MGRAGVLVFSHWETGVNVLNESRTCKQKDRLHLLRLVVLLDQLTDRVVSSSNMRVGLQERNLVTSMRELQREMQFLCRYFLIEPRDNEKGRRLWCWDGDCS